MARRAFALRLFEDRQPFGRRSGRAAIPIDAGFDRGAGFVDRRKKTVAAEEQKRFPRRVRLRQALEPFDEISFAKFLVAVFYDKRRFVDARPNVGTRRSVDALRAPFCVENRRFFRRRAEVLAFKETVRIDGEKFIGTREIRFDV